MIRKPRRFATAASASASVSPPALSSLILIASYFPVEPVEIGERPEGTIRAERDQML
jgi:hypothetical protein